jgi:exodeoxyribonuclease VIII
MMNTQTGIFYGVSRDEYVGVEAANQSTLKGYAKSAKNGKFIEDNRTESEEQRFGTALHCRMLEPAEFSSRYAFMPKVDGRTTEGKAIKAKAEIDNAGKILLSETGKLSLEWLAGCAASLEGHPDVANLFARGMEAEAMLVWEDPQTGILCKALTDAVVEGPLSTLGDLKTDGGDVQADSFSFTMYKWGYHFQAAYYLDGYKAITGRDANFVIVPVESKPPHHCEFYQINGPSIALGRREYRRVLPIWAKAKATGEYPGLPQGVHEIGVPNFRLKGLST